MPSTHKQRSLNEETRRRRIVICRDALTEKPNPPKAQGFPFKGL
jgi:hypothetical protein